MKLLSILILLLVSASAFGQRYVVYDTDVNAVVAGPIKHPRADFGPVQGQPPNYVLAEIQVLSQPTFDPATQRLQRDAVSACTFAVGPPAVCTVNWSVQALTQPEIDAYAFVQNQILRTGQARTDVPRLGTTIDRADYVTIAPASLSNNSQRNQAIAQLSQNVAELQADLKFATRAIRRLVRLSHCKDEGCN